MSTRQPLWHPPAGDTPQSESTPRYRVYKLGGGTVADAARIRHSLSCIHWGSRPLLVVSAPAGVTDRLCYCIAARQEGRKRDLEYGLKRVLNQFTGLASELLEPGEAQRYTFTLQEWIEQHGAHAEPARLMARGELWNARLIAHYLSQQQHPACALDARDFIRADNEGAGAYVAQLPRYLPATPTIAVITGFIARNQHGATVTLGRDGSDYTAALIAEAAGARQLFFLTDTPGIRSADPQRLGNPGQRISCCGHREAKTLVQLGGGVLHPRTIKPLERAGITACIGLPGDTSRTTQLVPGSYWPGGGIGLFVKPQPAGIDHIFIPLPPPANIANAAQQSTATHNLAAFQRYWPQARLVNNHIVLHTAAEQTVNQQLRAIHQRLYEQIQPVRLVLVGPGQVGAAVLRQLNQRDFHHRLDYKIGWYLDQIINSKGTCFQADPDAHPPVLDPFGQLQYSDKTPTIIIDTTASKAVAALHSQWLDAGCGVVTANKHSLSGTQHTAQELLRHAAFAASTTVGAGLPFIKTLQERFDTGHHSPSLSAVLSGSVNYLLDQLQHGVAFHTALQQARELGLMEPDASDDLGGWDSARKLLILARAAGFQGELNCIQRTSLDNGQAPQTLAKMIQQAQQTGQVVRYIACWQNGQLTVGPRAISERSPLAVSGCHNALLLHDDGPSQQTPPITGPGAGPEVTASGILRDLLQVARALTAHRQGVQSRLITAPLEACQ